MRMNYTNNAVDLISGVISSLRIEFFYICKEICVYNLEAWVAVYVDPNNVNRRWATRFMAANFGILDFVIKNLSIVVSVPVGILNHICCNYG